MVAEDAAAVEKMAATLKGLGAAFMTMLRPLQDRVFRRARAEGRKESFEAYGADALAEMVRIAASRSGAASAPAGGAPDRWVAPAKVIVRCDWDAFIRGFPIGGEVCEIAGIGPVPVRVVRSIIETGDPFLAAVVTRGTDVVNVAHLGRRATAKQLTALEWLDPECPALGCSAKVNLEIDHTEDWAATKITLPKLLSRPCSHHHDLKTGHGWAFVDGVGKRPTVPPDDPRHPNYQERAGPEGERAA